MELTGRCLGFFWVWYLMDEQKEKYKTGSLYGSNPAIKIRFMAMSFTERYGVYVDFFDSINICVDVFSDSQYPDIYFDYYIRELKEGDMEWCRGTVARFKNRDEARIEAIEQVNKISNESI